VPTVLFDLDGTIIDSSPGILRCVSAALSDFGYSAPTASEIGRFVGPPLGTSLAAWGVSENDLDLVVAAYRTYYESEGLWDYSLYEGIDGVIEELAGRGWRIGLATLKPERFAGLIAEHAGIHQFLSTVAGAGSDNSEENKADVIRVALRRLGSQPSDTIMIGDREHDAEGAQATGCSFIGVTWGFGSATEMRAYGAELFAESTTQLIELLEVAAPTSLN
jgi:phosphoglycolate phosphatase